MDLNITELNTKWGKARIYGGYFKISRRKSGEPMKILHHLIWEEFYHCKVPEGYIIHHKNENKLDNCILNLQLIKRTDHIKLHHTGAKRTEATKSNMSKNHADVSGSNNPRSIYKLWDNKIVKFKKPNMFTVNNKRGLTPRRCFVYKYKGKEVPIGSFHDFTTVEILDELVKEAS